MNNKKSFLILLIIFALLLAGAYMLYTELAKNQSPDQLAGMDGETADTDVTSDSGSEVDETSQTESPESNLMKAPDFTVYDADGNSHKLSDYFGKPIVLNFWASWCGPCKMEMPDFNDKYQEIGDEIQFLMVNMTGGRETLSGAKKFIMDKGYVFPVFYDTDLDAAEVYSVYSLPTTYFINSDGYLVTRATGAINAATLQRGIDIIRTEQGK